MNYACRSYRWRIRKCTARPEDLIRSLIDALVVHLSGDSLGHIKGYVAFGGGRVFASSALIPPEVSVKQTGEYHGGEMWMKVTLIFFNLSREVMDRAQELAVEKIVRLWDCAMEEGNGGQRGD